MVLTRRKGNNQNQNTVDRAGIYESIINSDGVVALIDLEINKRVATVQQQKTRGVIFAWLQQNTLQII